MPPSPPPLPLVCLSLWSLAAPLLAAEPLPAVPEGFRVSVFAREPMVRNPCAMTFDARGRLFVSQGQQYRHPEPHTPGDRVTILLDDDGDGVADQAGTFAEGFNHIQGLAWRGNELWVANAPDLTVVRDIDGDDVADAYERIYGGLGNLEHALHGLNFAPDGLLYMSKGNSKGYGRRDSPERFVAPQPFLDLWDIDAHGPAGTPGTRHAARQVDTRASYRRGYHHPSDDWGREGGVLRCRPDGSHLEVFSRGCRNPWDIAYDADFDWLATDQDQDGGDRILRPFFGAHFGWGHAWSPHWTGEDHLPTVPVSGPTFHGSGTGVVYYASDQFPPPYRGVFFFNDWLKRRTCVFRPRWNGAMMRNMVDPEVFAAAPTGRAMGSSSGMLFDPVDLEVGPDGALWVLSWGHRYGATLRDGKQVDEGRVYRVSYGEVPPAAPASTPWRPCEHRRVTELVADLRHDRLPAMRIDAQDELVRRGAAARDALATALHAGPTAPGASTWIAWTIGRIDPGDPTIDALFARRAISPDTPLADRIQAARILAHRARRHGRQLPRAVLELLDHAEPRLRFAAVQALHEAGQRDAADRLWARAADEDDRATFYATWRALGDLEDPSALREKLADPRPGARRAALLALLETAALSGDEAAALRLDTDRHVAGLAASYVQKAGTAAEPVLAIEPAESRFDGAVEVRIVAASIPGLHVRYTLDGSAPTDTNGRRFKGTIRVEHDTVVRAALFRGRVRVGPVVEKQYERGGAPGQSTTATTLHPLLRVEVRGLRAASGSAYRLAPDGLRIGEPVFTNRPYAWVEVPPSLAGATTVQTANADADVGSTGETFLTFHIGEDAVVHVAHDRRIRTKPAWLRGFEPSGLMMRSQDTTYDLYHRSAAAGDVVLGGNTTDGRTSGRSQYAVVVAPVTAGASAPLTPRAEAATLAAVLPLVSNADARRGARLFFGQAGCGTCHRVGRAGNAFAPDLSDMGSRGDPRAIAEAILDPAAVITEGYQGVLVTTKDGEAHTGFVRRESGLRLDLVRGDGRVVSIRKADIAARRRTGSPVMPANFATLLSPQQVADVVAFLAAQGGTAGSAPPDSRDRKVPPPAATPLRPARTPAPRAPAAGTALNNPRSGQRWGDPRAGFHLEMLEGAVVIRLDGAAIARYVFRDRAIKRPFFAHVKTPGGIQVTRRHPPVEGEDPTDHATMHPGVWLAFAALDGVSFWHNREGQVVHEGFAGEPRAGERAAFATVQRYDAPGGRTVCRQRMQYEIVRDPAGYRIDLDARFRSDRAFSFGVKEEMGLGVRVATPIRVRGGRGTILSSTGGRNEKGTWGRPAAWWDYAGPIGAHEVGLMLMSAPGNPSVWSHSRDYGVLVANPFPVDRPENRGKRVTIPVGETFRLRFGVLVHESTSGDALQRAAAYRRYVESVE